MTTLPEKTERLHHAHPDLEGLKRLRAPFTGSQISKLPKATCPQDEYKRLQRESCAICGGWHPKQKTIHLDYVGHAALTDRLLEADPLWTWEPLAYDQHGLPAFDSTGGLWIRLTVCGVTRLGYGNARTTTFGDPGNREKEIIGDALRNAGMRFGAALDLWHKGDLHAEDPGHEQTDAAGKTNGEPAHSSPFDRVVAAIKASRTADELAGVGELAKKLSKGDKARVKPIYAARRDELAREAKGGLDVDDLVPRGFFTSRDSAKLPTPLHGAFIYIENAEPHWHIADVDAGVWRPARSAKDVEVLRMHAEKRFASFGWKDLGEPGAVDLDEGGRRLFDLEQQQRRGGEDEAPAAVAAPPVAGQPAAAAPQREQRPAPANKRQAKPAAEALTMPEWAKKPELQGLVEVVDCGLGVLRQVLVYTTVLEALPPGEQCSVLFVVGSGTDLELFEFLDGSWKNRAADDPQLLPVVRKALSANVTKRALACRLSQDRLLDLFRAKTGLPAKTLKDLTERSVVLLRAALAELQQQNGAKK